MDEYNFFYGLFTGTSLFVQLIVAALLIISLWIVYSIFNSTANILLKYYKYYKKFDIQKTL